MSPGRPVRDFHARGPHGGALERGALKFPPERAAGAVEAGERAVSEPVRAVPNRRIGLGEAEERWPRSGARPALDLQGRVLPVGLVAGPPDPRRDDRRSVVRGQPGLTSG